MRVLWVASYPELGASSRYRVCQFLPLLERMGVQSSFVPFLSNETFKTFYQPQDKLRKGASLMFSTLRRLADVLAARQYDVVVVQREAALVGPPVFELLASKIAGTPLVFDLDDAIFIPTHKTKQTSAHGVFARLLKDPKKADRIARMADHIVVANDFGADWARRHGAPVTVIPTVVDPDVFCPVTERAEGPPVLGWIGSHSAGPQLEQIFPALERLAQKHRFVLRVVGAGRDYSIPGVEVDNRAWKLEREVEDFRTLDIGLCPLFDDQWSRGKPGFKPLIYMGCGLPQVSTPLGGVTSFVRHRENGCFAQTPEEWFNELDHLLSSPEVRAAMGAQARADFLAGPTLTNQAAVLFEVLQSVRRHWRSA